uniref:Alpha-2-macroglobulin domain-containing protein n=1 Tax=Astatotilapia calliptera TaxID=8154 RepID=A0AAX7VM46_ASTCA
CVCRQYLVAVPAVLESGAETKFCVSVLELTEPVVVNVTLKSTQLAKTYSQTNILCFQVPVVTNEEVMDFQVKVEGSGFQSEEVRKVLIRAYKPQTFIQTDKPIYLPGQQVHFRVVTLDSKLRPASTLVSDPSGNRIGQWLKTNSDNKILQLSYFLSSEAREGIYKITVTMGESKVYYTFTVEKYVLPKFDVTIKVCLLDFILICFIYVFIFNFNRYTFKQPVPGRVTVGVCRPTLGHFHGSEWIRVAEHIDESNSHDDTNPVNKCARKSKCFSQLSSFCNTAEILWIHTSSFSFQQVKAVYHNGEPIPDRIVYLFEGDISLSSIQNVKTDEKGVAVFSLSTNELKGDVQLHVSHFELQVFIYTEYSQIHLYHMILLAKYLFKVHLCSPPEFTSHINIWMVSFGFCVHQVSVHFVPPSAVPGDETNFQVTALPHSLCGVSAIDQSVLIKEPGKTLNAEKVTAFLTTTRSGGMLDKNEAVIFMVVSISFSAFFVDQCFWKGPYQVYKLDILERIPDAAASGAPALPPDISPIKTVRTFFPETWIWDLVDVRESGTEEMTLTVPDTITTWETEAFCLSSEGFGLAPREDLKVFQPFFLELTMPYSIIRGEFFELKATVFSYLTSCMMVICAATSSSLYTLTSLFGDQTTSCLCASKRKTFSWSLTPSALGVVEVTVSAEAVASVDLCDSGAVTVPDRGRIDVVTKPLIVKVEVLVELPYNVIEDSAHAFISVLGDILGRALKNLDSLLQLPSGCGEQNMALLAPNIFILEYLKDTQQLTSTIEEKATSYLITGYQNQLTYKHTDGSYSAFGTGEGSTWLTAFVVKCFARAEKFIHIDPRNIEESNTWLENQQRENGCFKMSGRLIHIGMKGGVSDEVTLTAYITATFLENKKYAKNSVVKKSLACLKDSMNDLSNTYTTALLAYVFTLAGDVETRAHLLEYLDKVAENFIYWTQKSTETSASLSVEISSYVLLAQISASPTSEELAYAFSIVRWLTEQQTYYGGFSSTQVVNSHRVYIKASVRSAQVVIAHDCNNVTFHVNRNNRLLYQEEIIVENIAGKYIVEMKGSTSVSVQVSAHINLVVPNKDEVTVHLSFKLNK